MASVGTEYQIFVGDHIMKVDHVIFKIGFKVNVGIAND